MTSIMVGGRSLRRAARAVAGALVLLGLGAIPGASVRAASECEGILDRKERLACKSSRLKEKFDRASEEAQRVADTLRGEAFLSLTTPEQRASLEATSARLERERKRVTADDLRGQAGSRKQVCPLKECDPEVDPACVDPVDGDGICEPGERCWEVLGDGVGDDVQPCDVAVFGRRREVCAEVCDGRATELDANVDEEALDEVETAYDDLGDVTQELGDALPGMAATAATLESLEGGGGEEDPCAVKAALGRGDHWWRIFRRIGATTVRAAADVAERFCDSNKMGTSASLACAAAEGVAGVAAGVQTAYEIAEGNIDAAVMDASLACASRARDKSKGLADRLSAAKAKLGAIEANQARIIELIETAQGLRPGFPVQ